MCEPPTLDRCGPFFLSRLLLALPRAFGTATSHELTPHPSGPCLTVSLDEFEDTVRSRRAWRLEHDASNDVYLEQQLLPALLRESRVPPEGERCRPGGARGWANARRALLTISGYPGISGYLPKM